MRAPVAAALLLLLAACTSRLPGPVPVATPSFPLERYAQALERGEPVYRIDPAVSEVVIRIYRAGALARLGHDHVAASRDVRGYVLLPRAIAFAQADIYLPLASLDVDEPARRAHAGFDTQPSRQDIDATRANMRDSVLHVARYPFALVRVVPSAGEPPRLVLTAQLTLHGTTRTFPVTAELDVTNPAVLSVNGRFSLNQTDFGIEPYAVFGGALRVADRLDVDFRLQAVRLQPGEKALPPA